MQSELKSLPTNNDIKDIEIRALAILFILSMCWSPMHGATRSVYNITRLYCKCDACNGLRLLLVTFVCFQVLINGCGIQLKKDLTKMQRFV